MTTPAPTIMRMVLVTLKSGAIRPAVIVEVHCDTCVSVSLFAGANDTELAQGAFGAIPAVVRLTKLQHDQEGKRPITWHWSEHQVSDGKHSH